MAGVFNDDIGQVIDLNFITHEAMIEAAMFWDITQYQVERGSFRGFTTLVHTQSIQIGYSYRSRGIVAKGKSPSGCYMFLTAHSQSPLTHNGISLMSDELLVLDDEDEIDFTSSHESNDFAISIDKGFLELEFERYFNKPFDYDKVNKRLQLKPNTGIELTRACKEILNSLIIKKEKLKTDAIFHTKAEQDILQILFQSLDLDKERQEVLQNEVEANELRQYIESHFREDIYMKEVCHYLTLCERTVRESFKKLFGFTPKHYLMLYRLGKVYRSLLKGDSSHTTVENIAFDNGFYHMGRFSQQYQDMYGKLPSCTLKLETL